MARKLIQYEAVTSDLDGSDLPADTKSTQFAWDNGSGLRLHSIDLSDVDRKELEELLTPYIENAHRTQKLASVSKVRGKPGPSPDAALPSDTPQKGGANPNSKTTALLRDRAARLALKDWANENGWNLGRNGRAPTDAILAYHEAFPDAYIPEFTLQDALRVAGENG